MCKVCGCGEGQTTIEDAAAAAGATLHRHADGTLHRHAHPHRGANDHHRPTMRLAASTSTSTARAHDTSTSTTRTRTRTRACAAHAHAHARHAHAHAHRHEHPQSRPPNADTTALDYGVGQPVPAWPASRSRGWCRSSATSCRATTLCRAQPPRARTLRLRAQPGVRPGSGKTSLLVRTIEASPSAAGGGDRGRPANQFRRRPHPRHRRAGLADQHRQGLPPRRGDGRNGARAACAGA